MLLRGIAWGLIVGLASACGDSDPAGGGGSGGVGGAGGVGGVGGVGGAPNPDGASLSIVRVSDGEVADEVMYYDALAAHVTDAEPGARYTLVASLGTFTSRSTFVATADGTIDSSTDAPTEGSWQGVDADAIFWSMSDDGGSPSFGDGTLTVELLRDERVLDSASVARREVAPQVTRSEVPERAGFVGVVYTPAGEGPHPVVVGFGGSEGGLWFGEALAQTYASLGYVAIGVAYFGEPTLPSGLTDVPLEYFESVFDYVETLADADASRVAVMGASRGGELALLLGAHYPDRVSAVVAVVPSGLVWGSADEENAAAWTFGGTPLPGVPSSGADPEVTTGPGGKAVYHFRSTFLDSLGSATPSELEAATIRVEDASGPILMISGDDDQLWPSCVLGDVAMERLTSSGHAAEHGDEHLCFADSGHFTNPINVGAPMTQASLSYNPSFDVYFAMGGTAEGLGKAARGSFERVRSFLETSLSR